MSLARQSSDGNFTNRRGGSATGRSCSIASPYSGGRTDIDRGGGNIRHDYAGVNHSLPLIGPRLWPNRWVAVQGFSASFVFVTAGFILELAVKFLVPLPLYVFRD
jgi:hypothetical protein